eukprot:TRINITY_DN50030_c0_g1_i2.p1 TRINITY_DN50030_c0_g1~~TRINITY_DN50030_c0_g1_i2.p1  ORF type:complete len:209 (+),score=-4.35 TRINITY_DN50030_c0_g1_i2:70-627(+)
MCIRDSFKIFYDKFSAFVFKDLKEFLPFKFMQFAKTLQDHPQNQILVSLLSKQKIETAVLFHLKQIPISMLLNNTLKNSKQFASQYKLSISKQSFQLVSIYLFKLFLLNHLQQNQLSIKIYLQQRQVSKGYNMWITLLYLLLQQYFLKQVNLGKLLELELRDQQSFLLMILLINLNLLIFFKLGC